MASPPEERVERRDRNRRRRAGLWAHILLIAVAVGGTVLGLVVAAGTARGTGVHVHAGYDEAVYVGASWLLRSAHVPYRDFVFVFPPGALVLLWPFTTVTAWFGGPALTVTAVRVGAAVAGGLTAYVLGRVTARELGGVAGVVAAAVFVTMPSVVVADGSGLQEPFVNLAVVAAAAVLTRRDGSRRARRAIVGGLLLGAAVSVKLVTGLFLVPFLLAAPFARPVTDRLRFAVASAVPLGVLGTVVAAVVGVRAPWDQAVVAQLLRPASVAGVDRVDTLLPLWHGQTAVSGFLAGTPRPVVVGVVGAMCLVAVWSRAAIVRLGAVSALVSGTYLLVSSSFYGHYAALVAPWLAVVVAWIASLLVHRVRARAAGRNAVTVATTLLVLALAAVVAAGQGVAGLDAGPGRGSRASHAIRTAIRDAPCVRAVRPQGLIDENRIPSADRHGHVLIDVYGSALAARVHHRTTSDGGPRRAFGAWAVPYVQAQLRALPHGCDALLMTDARCPEGSKDLTRATAEWLRRRTRVIARQGCTLVLRPRR
ncbi:MAG: hypothetical protein ACXVJF_16410 [Acidimicrobiia bacterium]